MDPALSSQPRLLAETAARLLAAALPQGWTFEAPRREHGTLQLVVRDASGRRHELVAAPAGAPAFVSGARFGWSYRAEAPVDEVQLRQYRAILETLANADSELWPAFESAAEPAPPRPTAPAQTLFLPELKLRLKTLAPGELALFKGPPGSARELFLFLETPCEQACEFCEVPQRAHRLERRLRAAVVGAHQAAHLDIVSTGAFDRLLASCAASNPPATLMITGFDWTRDPHLDALLSRLERETTVPITFLGPSTALADPKLAERVARLPTLRFVLLTLQSWDEARHDAMVGRPGAAAAVKAALAHLKRLGAPARVHVVLTKRAVEDLPQTLAALAQEGHKARLLGFIPDRVKGWNPGLLFAPATALRASLEASLPHVDTIESIDGVPHCAVPSRLRSRISPQVGSHLSETFVHPPACAPCDLKATCRGVPESFARHLGDTVRPENKGVPIAAAPAQGAA